MKDLYHCDFEISHTGSHPGMNGAIALAHDLRNKVAGVSRVRVSNVPTWGDPSAKPLVHIEFTLDGHIYLVVIEYIYGAKAKNYTVVRNEVFPVKSFRQKKALFAFFKEGDYRKTLTFSLEQSLDGL